MQHSDPAQQQGVSTAHLQHSPSMQGVPVAPCRGSAICKLLKQWQPTQTHLLVCRGSPLLFLTSVLYRSKASVHSLLAA